MVVFLNTNNELSEKEHKTWPFTIVSKKNT